MNAIANLSVKENAGRQTVPLSGISSGATNENQSLTFTVVSSNTNLISNPAVYYTNANTTGKLTFAPATNAYGTATIAVTVNDGGTSNNLVTRTFTIAVNNANQPPTLNAIGNLVLNENAGLQTVTLSGITSGAPEVNQKLKVTAVSSNTSLIHNPTIYYTNANTAGKLTFAPVTNANGTATITVTVNDGGKSNNIVTQTFTVTVNAVNQPPTLKALGNLAIKENAGLQTVKLSDISSGAANEIQNLKVSAVSSNPGLIFNPTVYYTNANTAGKLTFAPVTNTYGTATIAVTVNDGGTSNNIVTRSFTVTVNAVNQPPTLNALGNLALKENAGLQTVTLSGITSGAANENQGLTVTAISSSTTLIPKPTVTYTSPNTTGSLTFKPTPNKTGKAVITVTVNDGGKSNNIVTRTFTVTLTGQPRLGSQLTNQFALIGQTKTFTIKATGTGALKYQWKLNGTNLPSAVGSSLTLKNVSISQSGAYTVTVTDSNGSITSTALLTVYATAAGTLASTAYASGQFALNVSGVSGGQYVVQASTDMVNWVPLQTNTAPFIFVDTDASQFRPAILSLGLRALNHRNDPAPIFWTDGLSLRSCRLLPLAKPLRLEFDQAELLLKPVPWISEAAETFARCSKVNRTTGSMSQRFRWLTECTCVGVVRC